MIHPLLVDCVWDKWDQLECSESCGGGERIVTRSAKIKAAYGGKECTGSSNIVEDCNVQQCPGAASIFLSP